MGFAEVVVVGDLEEEEVQGWEEGGGGGGGEDVEEFGLEGGFVDEGFVAVEVVEG